MVHSFCSFQKIKFTWNKQNLRLTLYCTLFSFDLLIDGVEDSTVLLKPCQSLAAHKWLEPFGNECPILQKTHGTFC